MFECGAYVHQYYKYGLKEEDFKESFRLVKRGTLSFVICEARSYRSFAETSSYVVSDMSYAVVHAGPPTTVVSPSSPPTPIPPSRTPESTNEFACR
ncbi:MAG: hypothetical protein BJ554DRAFT_87 [Olpidium bornovanus]|uniref:Uncharacterized protein n=1 Tax=Olpidium bornovanus TaxID=278681 RepID=A0A8H8DI54_9FUNG|nr:MAG: hypothetical protein BJ554DRAFT_87 [Olpidium bornovanus]